MRYKHAIFHQNSLNKTSFWLYNDLRLKNQIEKDKKYAKKELGTFCEQYGFDPLIAPSRRRKKEKTYIDRYERYKNKSRKYYKNKYKKEEHRKPYKKWKLDRQNNKKQITCDKYGKIGHISKNCRVKA